MKRKLQRSSPDSPTSTEASTAVVNVADELTKVGASAADELTEVGSGAKASVMMLPFCRWRMRSAKQTVTEVQWTGLHYLPVQLPTVKRCGQQSDFAQGRKMQAIHRRTCVSCPHSRQCDPSELDFIGLPTDLYDRCNAHYSRMTMFLHDILSVLQLCDITRNHKPLVYLCAWRYHYLDATCELPGLHCDIIRIAHLVSSELELIFIISANALHLLSNLVIPSSTRILLYGS